MSQAYDIVIIGAGITGLALSGILRTRGVPHVVLEAEAVPGGAIRTRVVNGHILEEGPQRTRLTPGMHALIAELGISGEVLTAPAGLPLSIFARGKLRAAPLSLTQLVTTDLLSPAAKVRLLLEPLTKPAGADESVAGFFIRRFGRAAYLDLLGPLFGGLYASDPADMRVRHALAPALRELGIRRSAVAALIRRRFRSAGAPPISFRRGLRTLTDAMHERVREHVHLGTPVRAITPDRSGFVVATDANVITARHVVLTNPAAAAAALLARCAPEAATALQRLRYNPLALVYLHSDAGARGLGYQVSFRETLQTRGVTFNESLFSRPRLYTAFLGGAKDPAVVNRPDHELMSLAAREFEEVMGAAAEGIAVARTTVPAWDRTWDALDGLRLPPGIHLAANYESRIGIPGRLYRARAVAESILPLLGGDGRASGVNPPPDI